MPFVRATVHAVAGATSTVLAYPETPGGKMSTPLRIALTDPKLPVGKMIPVRSDSIPRRVHPEHNNSMRAYAGKNWTELYCPTDACGEGQCKFGCKVYYRTWGETYRFAVFHSLTYGHSHSPGVR